MKLLDVFWLCYVTSPFTLAPRLQRPSAQKGGRPPFWTARALNQHEDRTKPDDNRGAAARVGRPSIPHRLADDLINVRRVRLAANRVYCRYFDENGNDKHDNGQTTP